MYNPKNVLTDDGYENYRTHLKNIENGFNYIEGHADDLHIGATNGKQFDDFINLLGAWSRLKDILKNGDGEKDNE